MLPSFPARSATLNTMLLLPLSVALFQLMAVPLTLVVMSVQLVPPLTEPYRMSPVAKAADRVALMVWAAVVVLKSVLLLLLLLVLLALLHDQPRMLLVQHLLTL